MGKRIWVVAFVVAMVVGLSNVFDSGATNIVRHWVARADSATVAAYADSAAKVSFVGLAGRDTLSSDGKGLDAQGYKWVACTDVGDSTDTAILLTFAECGCTVKPNENAIPFADSLVRDAGFMARITYTNADPIGFSWLVIRH